MNPADTLLMIDEHNQQGQYNVVVLVQATSRLAEQISHLTSFISPPASPATADVSSRLHFSQVVCRMVLPQEAYDWFSCRKRPETQAGLPVCSRPTPSPGFPSTVSEQEGPSSGVSGAFISPARVSLIPSLPRPTAYRSFSGTVHEQV